MKKIKVGIPRALIYYQNHVFWQQFLRGLNCKVIVGPPVDKEIITLGNKYLPEDTCLPYKSYIGEIIYLDNFCDYLLVTNIDNYGKLEVCPKFKNIYNNIKQIISSEKILKNSINYKRLQYEFIEAIKIAIKINKNPLRIIYSYLKAKRKQDKYNLTKELENKNKLNKPGKKVLIISEFYNLENQYIMNNIINILNKNNIIYLFSHYLDNKLAIEFSEYFSEDLKLKYESIALGSIYYYQYQIDGIILVSTNLCPLNAIFHNTLLMRKNRIPIINVTINEQNENDYQPLIDFINRIKKEKYE